MSYITSKFVNKVEVCVVINDPVFDEFASEHDFNIVRNWLSDKFEELYDREVEYVTIDGHCISLMVLPYIKDRQHHIVDMCTDLVQEWLSDTEA